MTSRRVRNRIREALSIILAAHWFAAAAAVATERLCRRRRFAYTAEFITGIHTMVRMCGRILAQVCEKLANAELAYLEAKRVWKEERDERDRIVRLLYRELGQLRWSLRKLLGRTAADHLLMVYGPTSRDPHALLYQAQHALHSLHDPEVASPLPRASGVVYDRVEMARPVERLAIDLKRAIYDVAGANARVIAALETQQKAIKEYDRHHGHVARLLESFLDVVGLPTLATAVRPGVKRRGRPPKKAPEDKHPDLVAEIQAAGRLVPVPEGLLDAWERFLGLPCPVQEASEALRKIQQPLHEVLEAEKKIAQPINELPEAEEIIVQPSNDLPEAEEKIVQPVNEAPEAEEKIAQPVNEQPENPVSLVTPTLPEPRHLRRQRRDRCGVRPARRISRIPSGSRRATKKEPPARGIRASASEWWRRLRGSG